MRATRGRRKGDAGATQGRRKGDYNRKTLYRKTLYRKTLDDAPPHHARVRLYLTSNPLVFHIRHKWFTEQAWNETILPLCHQLNTRDGGAIVITLQVDPIQRNYVTPCAHVLDRKERQTVRQALVLRRRR